MCGIVGKLNLAQEPIDEALVRRMCALSAHRGPDDEGVYMNRHVALGIRRLSVIDVATGGQPQSNEDGKTWIVCNGEIYNFRDLRAELVRKGHRFTTQSDTEVIVHLYEEMGERCVERLNGMFAFAIWDERQQRMVLARDRLGQKPLHYALTGEGLTFASEIPPILEDPAVEREIELRALHQYLRLKYVPGPLTMFNGVNKLPPAHMMICENGHTSLEQYWDVDYSRKLNLTEEEWEERVLALLQDAVRLRLVTDMPLGALLSGGIDSSLIVSLMQQSTEHPIKTFSIGFEAQSHNELPYARQVAEHVGADYHEEFVRPDAVDVLPTLVQHYGEPFGDDSCIPTYYLAQMAREHVTVALSGDGGDESFGGYPRVARLANFGPAHSLYGLFSQEVRRVVSSERLLNALLDRERWRAFKDELSFRISEILDPTERYLNQWGVWRGTNGQLLSPEILQALDGEDCFGFVDKVWQDTKSWHPVDRILYLELLTYLPYDLQVKMDIASMAVSLEVRSPFLDHRLVELAAAMPPKLKLRNGDTKILLRRVARRMLPQRIVARPKMGFSIPRADWLRGDMKPMVYDLLLDGTARQRGIFQPDVVHRMVQQHMAGDPGYDRYIWLMLNFELWCRLFLDRS